MRRKTWTLVTPAEVVKWHKLSASGVSNHEIGRMFGRSHMTVGNYLNGKLVACEPEGPSDDGIPDACAEAECGVKGTKLVPLQRNLDGQYRCVECAAKWEAKRRGKAK